MKTEKIYTQHNENKEWMSSLLFYKDEIKIMKHRLEEIAAKNNSREITALVEHFQNQFIIQDDHIDRLKHELNIDNDGIDKEILKNENSVDHRSIADHSVIRESMSSFEKIFTSLKAEFKNFLVQRM
ncbi:MAG: hypothetical protein ACJ76F_10365 [Bacteroidia bacterium]